MDHQTWVEGELQAITSDGISNGGEVYLGGLNDSPPQHLTGLSGFHGCIQHVCSKQTILNSAIVPTEQQAHEAFF